MTSRKPIRRVRVRGAKIVKTDWTRTREVEIAKAGEVLQLRLDGRRREDWEVKIAELMAEDAIVCIEYFPQLWEIGGNWGVVNYLLWVEREQVEKES